MFPSDWYIPQDNGVVIFSRLISSGGLTLNISPSNNKSLAEITSSQIQRIINLTDFKIIESNFTTLSESPAYIIKYSYTCSSQECLCSNGDTCARPIRKEIEAWTTIGNNTYSVRIAEGYPGSTDNLSYWLQVQKMLDSLHIEHR